MGPQDGRYLRRPWDSEERTVRYDYMGPFGNLEEALTARALSAATMPGDQLSELVRPPLKQINPFPPRFGYRTRALGIGDIMDVDDIYRQPKFAGGFGAYEGTSRNAQGTGFM